MLLAAAGCTVSGPYGGPSRPIEPARPAIEGDWVDTNGAGVSTFRGGTVVTVATDTGQRLSEGTYLMRDTSTVDISLTSLIRGTQINAACAMVTTNQLNCTASSGQQFTLLRRVV